MYKQIYQADGLLTPLPNFFTFSWYSHLILSLTSTLTVESVVHRGESRMGSLTPPLSFPCSPHLQHPQSPSNLTLVPYHHPHTFLSVYRTSRLSVNLSDCQPLTSTIACTSISSLSNLYRFHRYIVSRVHQSVEGRRYF